MWHTVVKSGKAISCVGFKDATRSLRALLQWAGLPEATEPLC